MEQKDYAIDIPDERDYKYNELFGAEETLPESFLIDDGEYQDQSLEDITKYMCVFYASSHGSNIQNDYEGSEVRIGGKELGLIALEEELLNPQFGAAIQSGPWLLREKGYIKGWAKLNTLYEIKDSIYNERPIVVGSNKVKWSDAKVEPFVATIGESYGHAFVIIGYDDESETIVCKNSYGEGKFDNGKFYIKYDDVGEILFPSKYSLIDALDPILEYKRQIMNNIDLEPAVRAFELGLWNGERPRENISRQECATIVMRAIENMSK